jgi:hypothetical protein
MLAPSYLLMTLIRVSVAHGVTIVTEVEEKVKQIQANILATQSR